MTNFLEPVNSDDALVTQARAGDKNAFGKIAYRYQNALLCVARSICRSASDAEDAVQDALLLAYLHLGQLRDTSRLAPWLRRVTVNACRRSLRVHKPTVPLDAASRLVTEETAAIDSRLFFEATLRCLSPQTRLTVRLRYGRELSLGEIAAFLEVPETTIKSRLRNARARLKKELETMKQPLNENKATRRDDVAPRLLRSLDSTGDVSHITFSPDGTHVVTAAVLETNTQKCDSVISCWDNAGNPVWAMPHSSWIFCPTFLQNGEQIVVSAGLPEQRGGREGQLMVLDAAAGTLVRTIAALPSARCVAVSPDANRVALGGQEEYDTYRASGLQGVATVYDLTTGKPLFKVAPHLNYVTSLAFAPDGVTFATSSHLRDADPEAQKIWRGGDVRIWNATTGVLIHKLVRPHDTGHRHNIAFSPDGTQIAVPDGWEGDVFLFDTATGRLRHTLKGGGEPAFALAFAPNGGTLAGGYGDKAVRLFDTQTGRQRRVLAHEHGVYALAFSPDGATLVTADKNGLVQFWAV